MYYGNIKKNDIANGEGVRTSLFVSGCRLHCKNCFNKVTWDFEYGSRFTKDTEDEILESLKPNYIKGLTVLGGEPMEEENQEALLPFFKRVKAVYPNKDIWVYTGYRLEVDLLEGGRKHTAYTNELLHSIDVLVDGPFMEDKKDISLKFRGSSNQRILQMKEQLMK